MDPIDGYNDLKQTSNFMHFTSLMDSARESISLVHNSLAWHSREPSVLEAEIIGKRIRFNIDVIKKEKSSNYRLLIFIQILHVKSGLKHVLKLYALCINIKCQLGTYSRE